MASRSVVGVFITDVDLGRFDLIPERFRADDYENIETGRHYFVKWIDGVWYAFHVIDIGEFALFIFLCTLFTGKQNFGLKAPFLIYGI